MNIKKIGYLKMTTEFFVNLINENLLSLLYETFQPILIESDSLNSNSLLMYCFSDEFEEIETEISLTDFIKSRYRLTDIPEYTCGITSSITDEESNIEYKINSIRRVDDIIRI